MHFRQPFFGQCLAGRNAGFERRARTKDEDELPIRHVIVDARELLENPVKISFIDQSIVWHAYSPYVCM